MDALSDSQQSIRDLAREFTEKALRPVVKDMESGNLDVLREMWRQLAAFGLTGLPFPEQYGGAGVDSLSYILTLEEIAKVSAGLATALSVHTSVGGMPVLNHGSPAQKEKYLPGIAEGKTIAAFCLTDADSGSDAGSNLSRVEREGDVYFLSGSKIFITNALLADVFMVTAHTGGREKTSGISAFILERGMPGFEIKPGDEKMGINGSDWGELYFDRCPVPLENRLGEEGEGYKIFMKSLAIGRIGIGAISLGIAEACLAESLRYAQERRQFKKALSEFQAVQFKLADMATKIEASRALVYHAARLKEAGVSFTKEAAIAKLFASEACNFCAKEAVQIFGGYGYTKDFPVERFFRDAKMTEIVEGTSQIQRMIIARHVLND